MQGRNESSEWQDKWQQAVKELADVKERAWSLLEEKDLQLQSLKVTSLPLLHVGSWSMTCRIVNGMHSFIGLIWCNVQHEAFVLACHPWAAQCNTWLLIKASLEGVVFPFLFSLHAALGILPQFQNNTVTNMGPDVNYLNFRQTFSVPFD